jgi:two-component sensor histidine kinase/PAS domain-containing protein
VARRKRIDEHGGMSSPSWRRWDSVRLRLLLLAGVPLIAAGATALIVFTQHVRPLVAEQMRDELDRTSREKARIVDSWIREQHGTLSFIAGMPDVTAWEVDTLATAATRTSEAFPQFRAIVFIDRDGQVLVDSVGGDGGYVGDRTYFQRARSGEATVTNIAVARTSSAHMIIFAAPVRGPVEEIMGVVAAPMRPETLDAVLETGQRDSGALSYILDDAGELVTGEGPRRPDEVFFATTGSYRNHDGVEVWAAVTPLAEEGWILVSEIPVSLVSGTFRRYNEVLLMVLIATLILTTIPAVMIAATIQRPIAELDRLSQVVASGHYDQIEAIPAGFATPGELRRLQLALSTMATMVVRRRADLEASNRLLTATQEMARVGSWEYTAATGSLRMSETALGIIGLPRSTTLVKRRKVIAAIPPNHSREFGRRFIASIRNGSDGFEMEHPIVRLDSGEERFVLQRCLHSRDAAGRVIHTRGMVHDITDRHSLEESLREAVNEKTALLQEVHHRVRNNLAIIRSLISLKQELLPDGSRGKRVLQDMYGRITSMALLHDQLYESDTYSRIDMEEYLNALLDGIEHSYGLPGVRLERRIGSIEVEMHRVIPCGMIVNELLANAYKYAFPDGAGVITVTVSQEHQIAAGKADPEMSVVVSDDGAGLSESERAAEGTRPGRREGIGHTLVHQLAQQLGGTVTWDLPPRGGTTVTVRFPAAPLPG